MYKIGIILLPGAYLYSIGAFRDACQIANGHISTQLGEEASQFDCKTIGPTDHSVRSSCQMELRGEISLSDAHGFDLIYVPAFHYAGIAAFSQMAETEYRVIDRLKAFYKEGAVLAANCTGTFVLAETGLLNDRKATTAWWLEQTFRRRFPKVRLDASAVLAEESRLITTGAMTANLNMAMAIIGRFAGPHVAAISAKTMLIDTSIRSQQPFQDLMHPELSGDPLVAKAQYWLQNHLGEDVDQMSLADRMSVSQRTLIRKFRSELGVTPVGYLQNLRVEGAKRLLEDGSTPIVEIVERVGYSDVSSFTRLFKSKTGVTPHAFRQRFGRMKASVD